MSGTTSDYFERMWRADDPWDQERRFSERRKFDVTVSSLPAPRYQRAFEPGCATGILTAMLSTRCDEVVAIDRHPHAVEVTRRRVQSLDNVAVRGGRLPDDVPAGPFDLIVFSEVLYYLDEPGVMASIARVTESTARGAHLVAVHYRPEVVDHELRGDAVHSLLRRAPGWRSLIEHREADFVLDVCERT